ncbi:MAG: metallophosphoesterase [Thermoplasmatota archaeon]
MKRLQPLWNHKAMSIDKTLVIADLHIGYERELEEKGVNLPSQTYVMINEIIEILNKNRYERLIINGDLKHNIPSGSWQEYKEIPELIDKLIENVDEIHLTPGNHDGKIEKYLPSEVIIQDSSGYVFDDVGILHGHANPSKDVLNSDMIVIAHSHPTISMFDNLGIREKIQCWVKVKIEYEEYKKDVILMPHFNHLMGGNSINENGYLGPLLNNSKIKDEEIYLLDGTFLGKLKDLKTLQMNILDNLNSEIE